MLQALSEFSETPSRYLIDVGNMYACTVHDTSTWLVTQLTSPTLAYIQLNPDPSRNHPPQRTPTSSFLPTLGSYTATKVNATLPVVAPPIHVLVKPPVGQTAVAALTHPSHLPFETLIVAPLEASVAVSVNLAVPDWPTVVEGLPPQNSMVPAMPPQMASSATFWSWKTMFPVLEQVVPVIAFGFMVSSALMARTSRWSIPTNG